MDFDAAVHVEVMQHPLEDVADGEEAQHPVLLVRIEIWEAGDGVEDVLGDVAVGEHHTLRQAGGAGGVNDGGELVGVDGVPATVQLFLLGLAAAVDDLAPGGGAGHVLKRVDLLEAGDLVLDGGDLVEELLIGDEAELAFAVVQDVDVILRGHRRVQGHVNATGLQDAVVHKVPLAAVVVGDQRDALAWLEAEGDEATAHRVHLVDELLGGIRDAVALIGHGHHGVLRGVGQLVTREIKKTGGVLHQVVVQGATM